jgi:hypothetical protein
VAVADGQVIGILHVEATRHGFGEIGMLVDRGWRDRGVGSALMGAWHSIDPPPRVRRPRAWYA